MTHPANSKSPPSKKTGLKIPAGKASSVATPREDVVRLRGSLQPEYTLARALAPKSCGI